MKLKPFGPPRPCNIGIITCINVSFQHLNGKHEVFKDIHTNETMIARFSPDSTMFVFDHKGMLLNNS